jgi:hypothetical protein
MTELQEFFSKFKIIHEHTGDYNEKKIFVDGDSLILDSLSFYSDDYYNSLQIIYSIERTLSLYQRGNRKIEIVFFERFEKIWKNPTFLLLRKVVKLHLAKNFLFQEFYSPLSKEFEKYMEYNYPSFIYISSIYFFKTRRH